MKPKVFKIDDKWNYALGKRVVRGFDTKDEAQLAADQYVIDLAKKKKAREDKKVVKGKFEVTKPKIDAS